MVRILRLYRGEMGPGHLPDAGGIMDQSVLMLSALDMMAAFEAALTAKDAKPLNDDGEVDVVAVEQQAIASWLSVE